MKLKRIFPFNWIGDLVAFFPRVLLFMARSLRRSLRVQLMATFVICAIASAIVYAVSSKFFNVTNSVATIDYSQGRYEIDRIVEDITSSGEAPLTDEYITDRIQIHEHYGGSPRRIMVVDLEGNVLTVNNNVTEAKVDVYRLIQEASDLHNNDRYNDNRPYTIMKPVTFMGKKAFLSVSGTPQPNISYSYGSRQSTIPLFVAGASFFLLFFWLTRRKMRYIEELAGGLLEISKGDLAFRVQERSADELGSLAFNINYMTVELQRKIEEERRAEQTKNELVTNVSHDLRTPLTLIMGYLRLLKDNNYDSQQQADTYMNIAYGKAEKLKRLIDDLFEYTKLSNQGVGLRLERVCLNELLEQLLEEQVTHAEEEGLRFIRLLPRERLYVRVDTDKMIRVLENLLTNAVKYSVKPGDIRISLARSDDGIHVSVANIGEPISAEELSRLFERFYRVDTARTSSSGGSGLGLAIAKSIVDLHGGAIWAESDGDLIRFTVRLVEA